MDRCEVGQVRRACLFFQKALVGSVAIRLTRKLICLGGIAIARVTASIVLLCDVQRSSFNPRLSGSLRLLQISLCAHTRQSAAGCSGPKLDLTIRDLI